MDQGETATAAATPGRLTDVANSAISLVLMGSTLAWAGDVLRIFGITVYTQQFLAWILGLGLALVFLTRRISRRMESYPVPWYDVLLALLGFACCAFIAFRYPVYSELVNEKPLEALIVGSITIVLCIEGLRRTAGAVLSVVVVGFFVLAMFGEHLPKVLAGAALEPGFLFYFTAWDPSAMLGTPMIIVTTIVISFVLFGQILIKAGGSQFFTEIAMLAVGRYRGGEAKISVMASGLFGSISGSVVSNIATTGVITIPLMRRVGYSPAQAGAIEAVASTGGQLMPPIMGAAAFLMAEFLEIPYTEVVVVAIVPAVMYYVALFILADLEAARRGIKPSTETEMPTLAHVIATGWYFPIPFAVLIYALFYLNYSPEYSALLGAATMLVLSMVFGFRGKRMSPLDVVLAVRDTGLAVLDIIMIGAAAGIVIGMLGISGLGFALTLALVKLGGGSVLAVLLVAAIVSIILGMGMPTVGVYILLSTLVAPSLIEVGVQPIAAHLFILYFGMMSMITPPVAIAAFAAASFTKADPMRTGFTAMKFGWVAYVIPFMFAFSPSFLLQGPWSTIAIDVFTATLSLWIISAAVIGYHVRTASILERLILAAAGIVLLLPSKAFAYPALVHIGAALVAFIIIAPGMLPLMKKRP